MPRGVPPQKKRQENFLYGSRSATPHARLTRKGKEMNTNMKRVISGLAALGIALSGMALGTSSAWADNSLQNKDSMGKITVVNPNDDSTQHSLNGYRLGSLYDVTAGDDQSLKSFQIDTNDDYVETIEAALKDVANPDESTKADSKTLYDLYAKSTYFHNTKGGAASQQDEANPLGWVAENITGNQLTGWSGKDNTTLRQFANALKAKFVEEGAPEATKSLTTGNNSVEEGYYLLLDQFDGASTNPGETASNRNAKPTQSIPILVTSTIPAEATTNRIEVTKDLGLVTLKSTAPSITKQVVTKYGDSYKSEENPDYNIGDDIYYELTTVIPDYTSYNKCAVYTIDGNSCRKLIVTDTAEKGLTIQGVESVKVGDASLTSEQYSTETSSVKVTYDGKTADGNNLANATKTTIDLGAYVNSDAVASNYGKIVTILVKAKLNKDANISTPDGLVPNKNRVELTYSNKFDNVSDAKTIPGGEVNVYTFKFKLNKTAMDGKTPITGAKFKIQKKDGSWLKRTTDGTETTKTVKWEDATNEDDATEFTAKSGNVEGFDGLEAGTYTVKETEAAPDYTSFQLPSFDIIIGATYEQDSSTKPATATAWGDHMLKTETISLPSDVDSRVSQADDMITINVKNAKNLTQLPMTGGAGLVAIIAVGVLLAGAGTAAAVRSRKSTSRAVRV